MDKRISKETTAYVYHKEDEEEEEEEYKIIDPPPPKIVTRISFYPVSHLQQQQQHLPTYLLHGAESFLRS